VRAVLAGHDDMGVVLLAGGRSKTLVFFSLGRRHHT
jgi:hypothetical protein